MVKSAIIDFARCDAMPKIMSIRMFMVNGWAADNFVVTNREPRLSAAHIQVHKRLMQGYIGSTGSSIPKAPILWISVYILVFGGLLILDGGTFISSPIAWFFQPNLV